ncbi:diacylglycerol kinase [Pseudomonas sp. NP21570]|jgi:diacylglycerol kinase (ATP)|uniref:Diacylglycerol kinase n=1 Tax=Stutzerimonas stutzeri CCUG 29243 TaxID=1196835 RepID=I4CX58_STUST|nr:MULTISPECIES: diacylglycerol kinase [Stutzerimonas]MCB4797172.1 diacylglycerol kinase [Pseudomonas sp. NP21570]OYW94429.1 MAG: diacylglycerol kinase [Pseudomonadales bacterium 32-61-5]RRV23256.1 diacylglycerol kinase [Pseudomonas sp. s199]AFM34665.1 diacylglycerol kinase [Stutzerimonas stutzeri CCUG 29243]MCF6783932.1 diacylglycerol kinase [Stutzerimonas stutzeri]
MSSEPTSVVADGAAGVDVPADGAALKGRSGLTRLWYAAGYSAAGLKAAYRGEAAFRQLVLLNLLLIPLAFLLDVSRVERAVLIAVVFLGLIVELLNSAIEATVDRISFELHPLAKQAKDMGSAAQLLALCLIGLVWAVILIP